jgi:hypothetical protein
VAGQELGKGWLRQEIFFFPPDLGLVDLGKDDVTSTHSRSETLIGSSRGFIGLMVEDSIGIGERRGRSSE